MSVITRREFRQNADEVEELASKEPVFVTNDGNIDLVVLSYRDYKRMKGAGHSLADLLSMPAVDDIEFEPPKLSDIGFKPADLD